MNSRIGSPYFQINPLINKNLADRLNVDAIRNRIKLMSNAPAETVNTLNGMGVNPAVKMTQKFHISYLDLMA